MAEHPKLHEEKTVIVEMQKEYGRVRYQPCNALAVQFLAGLVQKSFTDADLKWIQSLGYTILLQGSEVTEYLCPGSR